MAKIRVLVVDDAVVFRRLLTEELGRDPALDVVATAANGRIALARLTQTSPDVVVLDVEMPEMDGLATLAELRKTHPKLPVIMFSALTERGAAATLDALALGAADYFTKPDSAGGLDASLAVVREQLVPKIKTLFSARAARPSAGGAGPAVPPASGAAPARRPPAGTGAVRVLAIGTSTGGPNALAEVVGKLPADFPVPVLIVQHMPPMFTRLLAERLSMISKLRFREAATGDVLRPGEGRVAPGDFHLAANADGREVRLLVHQDPPENSCRPSVDVLLRSVARAYGPDSLTVILTGMGQDGLRGCEAVREAGGQVLAQDEASSVVWGMPGAVARAGLADRVLPLSLIADEVVRRVRDGQESR